MSNIISGKDGHAGNPNLKNAVTTAFTQSKSRDRPCMLLTEPWVRNSRKKRAIKDIVRPAPAHKPR